MVQVPGCDISGLLHTTAKQLYHGRVQDVVYIKQATYTVALLWIIEQATTTH